MKKLMAVALVFFTLTCIFTACKKSDNIPPADIKVIDLNTTRPTEKTTSVRQNKKIKVQIPSAFIESEAGGDIEKYAATFGYKIKESKDGNITLEMDGRTYSLMLSGISIRVMIALADVVNSGDFPYAVNIGDYNEDYSYILMLVNSDKYKKAGGTPSYEDFARVVSLSGLYYQGFTTEKENSCEVIIADHKSGEVLYRNVYTN